MPTLYVMCGIPGSGKTTLLMELFSDREVVVLNLDQYRKHILGHQYHAPAEPLAHAWIDTTARYLLAMGHDVILDATHIRQGLREKQVRLAHSLGAHAVCVFLDFRAGMPIVVDGNPIRLDGEDLAREWNEKRKESGAFVPDEIMNRMVEDFERPSSEEGFDELRRFVLHKKPDGGFRWVLSGQQV